MRRGTERTWRSSCGGDSGACVVVWRLESEEDGRWEMRK